MPTFETTRVVAAPRAHVWDVVSDAPGLADHAPNLSASEVLEGSGEGMVRRRYRHAGAGWSETCTLWDPGHRYTMEVDTSDYPYPLRVMRGTWAVEDGPAGTRIRLRYDYEVKYGLAGRALGVLLRPHSHARAARCSTATRRRSGRPLRRLLADPLDALEVLSGFATLVRGSRSSWAS
jgi:ribosome-associated toxin RatA of RatAB toxin-antitoxin module